MQNQAYNAINSVCLDQSTLCFRTFTLTQGKPVYTAIPPSRVMQDGDLDGHKCICSGQ